MIWIAVFIVSLLVEIFTTTFVFVALCVGAVVAFCFDLANLSLTSQIIAFIITSIIVILLIKPIAKKYLVKKVEKTNVDAFIGEKAIVTTPISNKKQKGEVKYKHVIYNACSLNDEDIEKGETVIIERVEGVRLFVRKEDNLSSETKSSVSKQEA